MKLFLSSARLTNSKIVKAFEDLIGLPKNQIKVAFIPTAASIEEGDKDWLINDYVNLKKQGCFALYSTLPQKDIAFFRSSFAVL